MKSGGACREAQKEPCPAYHHKPDIQFSQQNFTVNNNKTYKTYMNKTYMNHFIYYTSSYFEEITNPIGGYFSECEFFQYKNYGTTLHGCNLQYYKQFLIIKHWPTKYSLNEPSVYTALTQVFS